MINVLNQTDSIRVVKHFNSTNYNKVELIEFANGDLIETSVITQIAIQNQATAGNDIITGTNGRDTLAGLAGNDTLSGGDGGDGGDIYYFSDGFGQDIVRESKLAITADDDSIIFAGNLTSNKVQFSRVIQNNASAHLVINFQGSTDQITIEKQFNNLQYNDVETFTFADGVTMTDLDVQKIILKDLTTIGDDSVVGYGGDDVFDVSLGNDTLVGGYGNDIYNFSRMMGQDFVRDVAYNNSSKNDIVQFDNGININNLTLKIIPVNFGNSDLLIGLNGTNDSMRISDQFDGGTYSTSEIEIYRFADGTQMTSEQMRLTYLERLATPENDVIQGSNRADYITGLAGNDSLIGAHGKDILVGGTGKDTLVGGADDDIFTFTNNADSTKENSDIITDFNPNGDKIKVTGLGYNGKLDTDGGNTAAGELRFYNSGSSAIITSDQTGFSVQLSGNYTATNFSDADFIW